ncbi:protein misato homolog 1-like isoform X1 [Zingiber officinale]|nr:protein misato homolog 1-like isoform X1 [Zingiber officinale]XP_042421680.1 protein misato homolog 1-like isoform X1 [Zingiber officinale]
MRELVTIQVGTYANFIGSHFWNFQDELLGLAEEPNRDPLFKSSDLDMDVLYRTGETQKGIPTYCPRLLSVGFQGSLGSLNISGFLYDHIQSPNPDVLTWTGNVARLVAEPHPKNLFLQSLYEEEHGKLDASEDDPASSLTKSIQDIARVECLENDVKFWTDFSKVQYHPQSLYELNNSWTDINKFDNYGIGKDVLSGGLLLEEMNERLRFFIEECDHIQGIQFVVDDFGGFSAAAVEILEDIADEYTNTPVLLYSVRDPCVYANAINQKSIARALHDAVSFSRLSSYCHLMIPVGLPSVRRAFSPLLLVEDHKPYHTSAVYASSMHSISIPFRMQMPGPATSSTFTSGAMDVGEIVHTLSGQSRQNMVTSLAIAMPPPSLIEENNQGTILRNLRSLTPELKEDHEDLLATESLVVQGAFYSDGHRATLSQVEDSLCAAYQREPSKPLFSRLSVALCPLPVPLPFPSIFGSKIGQHGELEYDAVQGVRPRGSLDVESIPMATRLRSSCAIVPFLEKRSGDLRKYGIARGAPGAGLLCGWGFEKDEVDDMGEHLVKLLTAFDPHSGTASDSD